MLKTLLTTSLFVAATTLPHVASAQTTAANSRLSIGVEGGAAAVENVGGLGGAEISVHLAPRIDVFAEVAYLQDVVTRRRMESADSIATYLSQTQGSTASANIHSPAWTGTAGVRLFLNTHAGLRPFVVGQAGMVRVTLRPAFTLAGADITTGLNQYGVTLGSDLTGASSHAVYGGGFGVRAGHGAWYIDAVVRVLSIRIEGQAANASTVMVGIGRNF